MSSIVIALLLLLFFNPATTTITTTSSSTTGNEILRIVYVMTTIPGSCGPFQDSCKQVLLQAMASQRFTEVVLLTNFKQCRWALHDLRNEALELRNISVVESHTIKSPRTLEFEKLIKRLIPKGHESDRILTSLYRYFLLEDYMTNHTVSELLHMDNDIMIYEDLLRFRPILRSSYPNLGAVASIHKRFISSSTLWIGKVQAISHLNTFLLSLGRNESGEFSHYTSWLREFACCRKKEQGGLFPDDQGRGIKAWALQDMTMLAYYHELHRNELRLFPTLPNLDMELPTSIIIQQHLILRDNDTTSRSDGTTKHNHEHMKEHHTNISLYAIGSHGTDVGSDLDGTLFDSSRGGWGDHFHSDLGRNREAHSSRHIIEQAILRYNCTITFKCALPKSSTSCYTKPFISCMSERQTSLLTMHALRSNTIQYRSVKCDCP
jgi:hypothetical protein